MMTQRFSVHFRSYIYLYQLVVNTNMNYISINNIDIGLQNTYTVNSHIIQYTYIVYI